MGIGIGFGFGNSQLLLGLLGLAPLGGSSAPHMAHSLPRLVFWFLLCHRPPPVAICCLSFLSFSSSSLLGIGIGARCAKRVPLSASRQSLGCST
jgi:hypothetical protein